MDAGNLQAIIDEALKSASDEANRRLAEQDKKLPPINTTVEASSQTNYRQPAQLEQRVTEMRFDPPPPVAPKPEGIIGDTLLFGGGSGLDEGIKPPLWITLRIVDDDPITYNAYAEFGHVVPRHNASDETGAPIEITLLPTPDAPLAVAAGNKLWVKLTIDAGGKCTYADFESGQEWPEDLPPELIGGDDQSGTEGERHIRIAEIVADPESTATPPPLISNQLHTGHIDHFQPELLENTTTLPGTGEARVMKRWNASTGVWEFRYLTAGDGVTITENADTVNIEIDPTYDFSTGTPDGIPDGETDGDMLYWDATAEVWILLLAPAAPDTGKRWVMHHDGTAPEWVEYDEVTVNICIDGLPTEYTILGIPTPPP
jgi:hypothetical protein